MLLIGQELVTAIVPASAGTVDMPGIGIVPSVDGSIDALDSPRRTAFTEVSRVVAERGAHPDCLGIEREQRILADVGI